MSDIHAQILTIARSYVGVRWRRRGTTKEHGVDCAGLVIAVMRDVGIPQAFTYADAYEIGNHETALLTIAERCFPRKPLGNALPGDVVGFVWKGTAHMGILGDAGAPFSSIHASARSRKVIEHGIGNQQGLGLLRVVYDMQAVGEKWGLV